VFLSAGIMLEYLNLKSVEESLFILGLFTTLLKSLNEVFSKEEEAALSDSDNSGFSIISNS